MPVTVTAPSRARRLAGAERVAAKPESRAPSLAPAADRVVALQRRVGNRAVAALLARAPLTVLAVDTNPDTGAPTDSTVDAGQLGTKILASPLNAQLSAKERQKIGSLGRANLQAAHVPALASAVLTYLVGATRARHLQQHIEGLINAIAELATTKASESEKSTFRRIRHGATVMSRLKGTPNQATLVKIASAQGIGALGTKITALTTDILNRNNDLHNVANYAANDPTTGVTSRANFGFAGIRSPHINGAGWLPVHVVANPEPALDVAARAWLAHVAANGTLAEQADVNQHFPPPTHATATSQQVEASGLSQALRNQYLTGPFALVVNTRALRIALGWQRYAAGNGAPTCPYIEFTATGAAGVSRLVWDYVNDSVFASVHYNWVDGFNPFFEITDAPAT